MKKYIEVYDKGVTKIEEDYDMVHYVKNMRELKIIKDWVKHANKKMNPNNKMSPFGEEKDDGA